MGRARRCGVWAAIWGVRGDAGCGRRCGVWATIWGVGGDAGCGQPFGAWAALFMVSAAVRRCAWPSPWSVGGCARGARGGARARGGRRGRR
eukprot:7029320-Prymnesium_polylepis.1